MKPLKIALALLGASLSHAALADDTSTLSKGEYLTRAADCVACHVVPGGKPFAGGLAFKLPFGTLYSPNITPDKDTGIGNWSDDEFVSAVQRGVGKDGKHYYPAFPYTSYSKMPREDILAIKAYLFSLQPVKQAPKENDLSFPFNQRWGMWFWNKIFLDDQRFVADPQQSQEWNRGAYLVEGPGHCGECHSPRNFAQAVDAKQSLAGTMLGNWRAYNISSDPQYGVGAWPQETLVKYFATGEAPGYGMAGGPMSDVIEHSLRFMTPEDLQAMAVYLKSTPARATGVARPSVAVNDPAPEAGDGLGKKVYTDACAACHRADGQGNNSSIATLTGLKTLNDPKGTNLIGVLLAGHNDAVRSDQRMPDFAKAYSNQELAAVSNYLLARFGQSGGRVTAQDVEKSRGLALH
ncbi:cytochrome c [Pseudomonas sp. dw_358]|uniref:cytochrome c n=1 Tax=Pseudomonas sp. dw_358 TaxID=2720083 RepID=UPI001BD4FCD2|nr:cytochrome c [Pseudomonas sp. dw_358]